MRSGKNENYYLQLRYHGSQWEKGSVPSLGQGVSKFTNNFTSLMFLNVISEAFLNANVKMMVF